MAIGDKDIPRIDTIGPDTITQVQPGKATFVQARKPRMDGTQVKPSMVGKAVNNLRATIQGSDSLAWYWWVLIVLAIAALSYGGWRLYKKYKK